MVYARTRNPEWFDYRDYEWEFEENNVIVEGGRDYCDIDPQGYLDKIKKMIDEYNCWDYEYYYRNSIKDYLTDMLPKKLNGKKLSPKEMHEIKKALDTDYRYRSDYEEEIIVLCLSIIYGTKYKAVGIRGCCQGDYATLYCKENDKNIDRYEAIYFGTGTEIEINTETEEEDIKDAEDIYGYVILTTEWSDESIKELIAHETNTTIDNVILYKWSGYARISTYEKC